MNGFALGLQALNLIMKLTPPAKHPPADYSEYNKLYSEYYDKRIQQMDAMPRFGEGFGISQPPLRTTVTVESPAQATEPEQLQLPAPSSDMKPVATSCMSCSQSHLSGIAGALDESLRFAREGGVTHPEVVERISDAEREIVTMERFDLSPTKILNSPQKEQELIRGFLPKIRKLRQDIGQIASVDQLERAASESSILANEFRLRKMEMAGADLNPIIALARAVEAGEMTIEDARERVKQYLPSEN